MFPRGASVNTTAALFHTEALCEPKPSFLWDKCPDVRLLGRAAVVWLCLDDHSGCWVGKESGGGGARGSWGPPGGVQLSRREGMMAWVWVGIVRRGEPEA